MSSVEKIPQLVRRLYKIVAELEQAFPERRFTLDGHLVGSIGEVLAASLYGITLLRASAKTHDGKAPDGKLVQIKATQGGSIGLRSQPDYLLVLQIKRSGTVVEIYNGPDRLVWNQCGKLQKNGQHPISVSKLHRLAEQVPVAERLSRIRT